MAEKIDLQRLERELITAVEADRRYWRENDAKFRAMNQKVATYEEFRDIVKASHLAPLDRKDITDTSRKQPWNPAALNSHLPHSLPSPHPQPCPSSSVVPRNAQDFTRHWRRLKALSSVDQYRFLLEMGGGQLYEIFRVEIGMGLLGELLGVLSECFVAEDSSEINSILQHLSRTSRFSLSVQFLSKQEQRMVLELFRKLSAAQHGVSSIHELARLYAVDLANT